MDLVRPPTAEELRLRELVIGARKLNAEKGADFIKDVPPYEEYMRMLLREKLDGDPEKAARFLLGGGSDSEVKKLLSPSSSTMGFSKKKPSFLQRRLTKKETRAIEQIIEMLKSM